MAVVLMITLVSMVQLQVQVPPVSAHEDAHVHPYMSEEAAKLLPEGSEMRAEIDAYMGGVTPTILNDMKGIRDGAYEEDHVDWVYSDLTHNLPGIVSITHFWDADKYPPEDRVKNIFGQDDMFPNAYEKACELFQTALDYYPQEKWMAYTALGHVAHLLEDMTVPAHVHEDFHPGIVLLDPLGGGDDSFENWMYEKGAYPLWDAESARIAGGLVTFPDDIESQMRQGNWRAGLYYLMYITNQCADYFASDDCNGDTFDKMGWMDYSNWPTSPRTTGDIADNDHGFLGDTFSDDDNNDDGDLGRIASYAYVYGIRAVATLYKTFYEATNPPTCSVSIDYADENVDGAADYRWVSLDLTYDVGADEYFRDLEARFRNEDEAWRNWERVGAVAGGYRKSWILSAGDGSKTVYCQVRNLMGLNSTDSASVELNEIGMPQLFDYDFSATGAASLTATVDFYVKKIWAGDVEFYFYTNVDNGGGSIIPGGGEQHQEPWSGGYYNVEYGVELDLTQLYSDDVGVRLTGPGISIPGGPFDWSYIHTVTVSPGQTLRLRTHAYDYNTVLSDTNLDTVWTPTYTVPHQAGTWTLANGWYETESDGTVNPYYSIWVTIIATVSSTPWSGVEVPDPNTAAVRYGAPEKHIADSTLLAPVASTTQWQAYISNPEIEYRMDGPSLYAWIDGEPDMVVTGLSPIILMITDPMGRRVGSGWYWTGLYEWDPLLMKLVPVYAIRTYDEVPGASIVQVPTISGDQITIIVFDQRDLGDYEIQVAPAEGADPTDTYSIGISTQYRKNAFMLPVRPRPRQYAFLTEGAQVSEIPTAPQVIQSDDAGVNLPPKADANGPYRATEGTTINFDASRSADPDGDSLTYRWDFENDDTWDTNWSSSPTASHTWNDDWTDTAKVEVSDGTYTATSTATVTVSNALPAVNAGTDQNAAPDEEVHFSGSFTDLGVADTHTLEWDFGDGTRVTDTLTPTHTFSEARKYTVTLTVTDDDNGVGRATLTIDTGVELSIDPSWAFVPPGEDTTYNVIVHHLGNVEDTFNLELFGLDSSWYSLSTTSAALEPDQSQLVSLTISPPITAPSGCYRFTIVATSQTDPAIIGTVDADAVVPLHIWSSDSLGNLQDVFLRGETVHATVPATGQPVTLYVVADQTTWNDGDALTDVSDGVETLTLNSGPGTQTIQIWAPPLVVGNYDIVMDVNNNGVYDAEIDLVDSVLITGFNVIPEVAFGTAMALLSMFLALVGVVGFKRFRKFRP